jgi:hypothetical protein
MNCGGAPCEIAIYLAGCGAFDEVSGMEALVSKVADYCVLEALRDGRAVRIRALKPEDQIGLLEAVRRSSPQSLYRRFFGLKRHFSEEEITYFLNVDFLNHVALVAGIEEDGLPAIVGGARYVVQEPGQAEIAFYRLIPRPWPRRCLDAPSRQNRPRRRAKSGYRRDPPRQYRHAQRVSEKRLWPPRRT